MKKSVIIIVLISCLFFNFSATQAQEDTKIIRFHVIANSDSREDQNLKLLIRDKVLEELVELNNADSLETAQILIKNKLNALEAEAETISKAQGYDYQINAQLTKSSFPTRKYNEKVVPAGEYLALKIIIGQGQGANWWCVLYPPLCHGDWMKKEKGVTRVEVEENAEAVAAMAVDDNLKHYEPSKNNLEENNFEELVKTCKKILIKIWTN